MHRVFEMGHITCGQVLKQTYDSDTVLFVNWLCPKCLLQQLPFWNNVDTCTTEEYVDNNIECNVLADSVNKDGSADNCDFELNTIKGIKLAHLSNVRSLAK